MAQIAILNKYRNELGRAYQKNVRYYPPPNDKTRTILAATPLCMVANGMAIVLSLFEV